MVRSADSRDSLRCLFDSGLAERVLDGHRELCVGVRGADTTGVVFTLVSLLPQAAMVNAMAPLATAIVRVLKVLFM